jgi:GNAT superfamily N-acetyltransferase
MLRGGLPGRRFWDWVAWRGNEAVGRARIAISATEHNAHSAWFSVGVRADARGHGLGREFLRVLAAAGRSADQSGLVTWTNSKVPSGGAFMARIGGEKKVEIIDSALDMKTLDRQLVAEWLARGRALAQEFELRAQVGPWPESQLDAACRMYEIMNTAPEHQLVFEPKPTTHEDIRSHESVEEAAGIERWTIYVCPAGQEAIAGYTEVFWRRDNPAALDQSATAVAPAHRGRGLAIWLKAAMLEKVLRDHPEVKRITTSSATTNEAMLSINDRLGFLPTHSDYMWQVPLESVLSYLAGKS